MYQLLLLTLTLTLHVLTFNVSHLNEKWIENCVNWINRNHKLQKN
ncbi:MAG: hypothetical protein ACI8RD_009057 [Bacillariaceae sp.]|jgi:hypothetical protein